MIRKKMHHTPVLPCMAACIALVLGACDRSAPSPDVQAPAAETAPAVAEAPAAAPAAPPAGPLVLTELSDAERSVGLVQSGLCSFDKVNGEPITSGSAFVVEDPATLAVAGWVGDKGTMTRPQANLRLTQVDGARSWEVSAGPPRGRGDVAQHLGKESMGDAGFKVEFDASALPPGEYGLTMVHETDGRTFACDKGAKIRIGG